MTENDKQSAIELLKIYLENKASEADRMRWRGGKCERCGIVLAWTPEDKRRLAKEHYARENFHKSNMQHLCPACCEQFMEFIS